MTDQTYNSVDIKITMPIFSDRWERELYYFQSNRSFIAGYVLRTFLMAKSYSKSLKGALHNGLFYFWPGPIFTK